jgi:serine protease DegS
MAKPRMLRFVASYVIVGVIVAVAVVWVAPGLLQPERPVVEIQQAPRSLQEPAAIVSGPVSYADAVALAAPAVVNVYTAKQVAAPRHPFFNDPLFRRFFGDRYDQPALRTETSLGSGVILSEEGYVLTNNHVIAGADEIQVLLADGRSAAATVVGTDPESDLAVLQIGLENLPTVTVGNAENLRVGDVVLAIGNPFGVGQTVTQGIVSATDRTQLGLTTFEDFIQTDAAINPGNSGGALINARGELIGINTAIYSRSGGSMGIGFAIPVSLAREVMKSIIEHGRMIRGWLGVQVQRLTPELARSFGVEEPGGALVAGVVAGGPAAVAGLRPGDILLAVDGERVEDVEALLRRVTDLDPGSTLEMTGLRNGRPFELRVTVSERPSVPLAR